MQKDTLKKGRKWKKILSCQKEQNVGIDLKIWLKKKKKGKQRWIQERNHKDQTWMRW